MCKVKLTTYSKLSHLFREIFRYSKNIEISELNNFNKMQWKKLIFIGDSNTQFGNGQSNWLPGIADALQRKCDIVNRGMSGYNSNFLRMILPQILEEFNPDFICGIVIMLGTNDSAANENQNVPLDKYKENLSYIVDHVLKFSKLKNEKIIVISPGRIFESKWQDYLKKQGAPNSGHTDKEVLKYAQVAMEVAKEKKVTSMDFNKIIRDTAGDNYGDLYADGLHLSKQGGDLLTKNLLVIVKKHIGDELKENFPDFKSLKKGVTKLDQ